MADLQERLARLPADRQRLLLARLAGEAAERGLGHRPLAIVGMAARVPGARDLAGFWDLLEAGRDAITEVPAGRWSVQGAPAQTRWGGFLDDVDAFDAEFFGISPREADGMDPQQRILLETAWTALEDAGIDPRSLAGSETGVFVGISNSEYAWRMVGRPELIDTHSAPGNAHSVAANRLSYLLDLRGPSVAVDTACSSSLVALHQAARSLAVGEAELAIVGGVNVILSPDTSISYARAGGLASDGRCKAFADGADGMVRSEGCGVLVLKDLDAARRAGDRVYAVLLGSAVNNDGRTNGLTAPSPAAQQAVVERALRSAGVPPADVQYVEAHGTGTALGDAIEAHALGASVGPTAARRARCAVGSVKSNIGHTESAAGVLAIVKTALAIRHRRLPPTLHVTRPNPRIPFETLGLAVRIEDGPWPEPDRRLVAGVSAFGFGGTNAHAVLAEPPAAAEPARPGGPALLTMSAAGPDELRALAAEYDELLARRPDDVAAVCAAAALRRAHEPHRLSAAAAKPEGLRERLAAFLAGRPAPGLSVTAGPTGAGVAFVYAGMGQRRPRSGDELRESEPAFRAAFDECETVFEELLRGPLPAAPDDLVGRQAWHFAAQVAQTALWRSWGIRPEAVCGHSVGEVAAAHCAGALTLADACRVVVARARQLAAGPEGRMLAAELEPAEVEETLAAFPDVEIAAENAPGAVVLAGSAEDIAAVTRRWEGARFLRLIDGQVVSHCGRVRPQAARLAAELSGLRPTAGDVPFVSAVTGGELAGTALDAEYWAANLSRPVRFEAAVRALLERGACTFLELSAVPALAPAVVQTAAAAGVRVTAVPAPRGGRAEREQLWQAPGRLYVQGVLPDFRALYGPWTPHRELPHRVWRRRRHWIDATPAPPPAPAAPAEPPAPASTDATAPAPPDAGDQLVAAVAAALGRPAGDLDRGRPLLDLGLDSILAVEIRDEVARSTGLMVPLRPMLEGASTDELLAALAGAGTAAGPDRLPATAEPDFAELPLSDGQAALWFLQQAAPAATAYVVGEATRVRGPLDVRALRAAFERVLARHPVLRSTFHETARGPVRRVQPVPEAAFELVNAEGIGESELRARLADLLHQPLDLRRPGLFRVIVFRLAPEEHVLLMVTHHLVGDFWSLAVILRELDALYPALAAGQEPELPPARHSYADYVRWQAEWLAGPEAAASLAFWRRRLGSEHPPAEVPAGRRPPVPTYRGGKVTATVDRATAAALRRLAEAGRSTLFGAVLAAFQALLARYGGAERFSLGTLTSGRARPELRDVVGYLVNPVVLRADLRGDPSFRALLDRVRAEAAEALDHAGMPFPRVVEAVQPDRDPSRSPLFQVLFAWQRAQDFDERGLTAFGVRDPGAAVRVAGLEFESIDLDHRTAQFDLSLLAAEVEGEIRLAIEYSADLYDEAFVGRLAENLCALLARLVAAPDAPLSTIDVLTPGERAAVVGDPAATARPYDLSRTLPELIAERAARQPDAVAVALDGDPEASLTYAELADAAARLATHLRARGVRPGDRVGLCEHRHPRLVVSLLGALMAGAAFVPLDPDQPLARLRLQSADAGLAALLSSTRLLADRPGLAEREVAVDAVLPGLPAPAPPAPPPGPADVAYVIFTSGSTGRPKGVAVAHRALLNRLLWMQEAFPLDADDVVVQKTPYTFDVSLWEFFWPLLAGARLVLARPGEHRDPRRLAELFERHGVTTAHFVPPMLDAFLAERGAAARARALRRVVCSGEALSRGTVARFFAEFGERAPELHNLYGPTEAAIDVTHWPCGPADADAGVPIGWPIANTRLYVLDDRGEPVPAGVPGELFIGGVQVAEGYVGRPDLTAERFVPDAFGARPGARLYRTGDRVRARSDGALEFLGRLDHQVKVRGFRVEPGEIEAALRRQDGVEQALVTLWRRGAEDARLVAYVVAASTDLEKVRGLLAAELPDYMVPAHLVRLDRLPLLANGKVDRAALPEPAPGAGPAPAEPRDERERLLHDAWCEVLGVSAVGLDESFFGLGGDSMLSIRLRAAVERRGWSFAIEDLLRGPTIGELAGRLRRLDRAGAAEAPVAPFALLAAADRERLPDAVEDAYPLSSMQAAMAYQAEFAEDTATYRVVTSLHVGEAFDEPALLAAIAATFARHPLLRSSFDLVTYSEPLQLVHREAAPELDVLDLSALAGDEQEAAVRGWVDAAKFHRFDLSEAPLVRFAVHRRGPESFQLTAVEHHVVLDGWSDGLMLSEILARYRAHRAGEALSLPPLVAAYRDFVAEERRVVAGGAARRYWTGALAGAPAAALPRRSGQTRTGHAEFAVGIDERTSSRLAEVARAEGLPLKALLAAAHLAVLRLVSGSSEVVTGVIANGRLEREGGDEVIGVFLNTLPLRMTVSGSWLSLARRVFEHERDGFPHRRYPFAELQRDLGGELTLDTYVNFVDFHLEQQLSARSGIRVLGGLGVAETNFPLAVNYLVDPMAGSLRLSLDCDLAVLDEELCARLAGYYGRALAAIAAAPEAEVAAADLIGAGELAVIAGANRTALDYDRGATVHGLIERRAAAAPDRVAVVHRDVRLTYGELDARANRLAHRLRELGVGGGSLVGVSLRRGPDLVVALLATLKAGAAYVPLDPGFPAARLRYVAADAGLDCVVADGRGPGDLPARRTVLLDSDAAELARQPDSPVPPSATAEDPAYVMYTSGSTGQPKGTVVRHRNVVSFFAGMDRRVGCDPDDVLLALTSVSFDISVLELLWPLTHGARVVIAGERVIEHLVEAPAAEARALSFSLFFFAAATGDHERGEGYRLLLEAAKFADAYGFEAVWTPERHFHAFGGLYPNPAVTSAALATITSRVALRSGSVVAPLHDTVRMAEEWALVDNLSGGRVGLAFASGWNSNDFVFFPEAFPRRRERMAEQLDEFRALWRGGPVGRRGGSGEVVEGRIFPSPIQETPPIWLTSAGTTETFLKAGAAGVNVLTHLLGQDLDELATKIAAYRAARAEHGHPGPGRVTVMVHAFLGEDDERTKAAAREPFRRYLRSSTELWRVLFASTGQPLPEMVTEADLEAVLDLAVERYFERSGLFGSPDGALPVAAAVARAGVDEVACLIDFGVPVPDVLEGLAHIERLRRRHQDDAADAAHPFARLCREHGVTLVQATPSFYAALAAEPAALDALRPARAVLVGGEAFPAGLAQRLLAALPGVRVLNMYGPTETTIWSAVHELEPARDGETETVPIGTPIANTELLVVDDAGRSAPVGVPGELWIGGDGVARGYLNRPELTAQRFVASPDGEGLVYRTGDRVRRRADGVLEFLGRLDRQVKILGHRVEPDEVESVLSRHPEVASVAVATVERAGGGAELVAYVAAGAPGQEVEQAHVRQWAEVWDSAYAGDEPFAGWVSSYTGQPIPAGEMREWLDHTAGRIAALRPRSVVDVGVGTGLLLRELAPRVERYLGFDVSAAAVARATAGSPAHVRLEQGDAARLADLPDASADVVVLNSVVQYFPGADYLDRVLREAARVAGPAGAVFVGDVRSLPLLEAFHATVQLHRAPRLQPARELAAAVERAVAEERELCLSPAALVAALGGSGRQVRIELKRGRADNEMTRFRFDVTARPAPAAGPRERVAWADLAGGLEELAERLRAAPDGLVVTGLPNRRLAEPLALVELLREAAAADTSVWDLERQLWERCDEETGVDPEAVAALGGRCGFRVTLPVPEDGRMATFDAVFELEGGA